jgi:hypothetical protein
MSERKIISENRPVQGFQRVDLRSIGQVVIQQGDQEGLTVETEADLLSDVITEVKNETLILDIGRSWLDRLFQGLKFTHIRHLRYIVQVKQLSGMSVAGAGSIETGALAADHLAIDIAGQGQITIGDLSAVELAVSISGQGTLHLAGQAGDQKIRLGGMGNYQAFDLQTRTAQVNISGNGTVNISAEDSLDVSISGMGTVQYRGSPKLSQRVSGLGSVKQVGED